MIVRVGEESDLPGILAIYNHYIRTSPATFEVHPLVPDDRRAWMVEHCRGGRHRLCVAVDDSDRVAGWATSSPFRSREAYATTVESSVYLRPDAEGHGVGSRLYDALFRSIAGEDVERIVAGITLPNPGSVRLHARFGFRPVGTFTRVGRKFDRFWDVAWFERPLQLPSIPPSDQVRGGGPAP